MYTTDALNRVANMSEGGERCVMRGRIVRQKRNTKLMAEGRAMEGSTAARVLALDGAWFRPRRIAWVW